MEAALTATAVVAVRGLEGSAPASAMLTRMAQRPLATAPLARMGR